MAPESTPDPPISLRASLQQARDDARRTPSRVVAWYGAFGVAWIVGSDLTVQALLGSTADAALAQTGKGLAFIGLSGALMYAITKRAEGNLSRSLQRAEQAEGLFLEAQRREVLAASVAEIVHDFRNNLAVVSGYADIAANKLGSGHDAAEYLAHIQQAAQSAREFSAQLLELAGGRKPAGGPSAQLTDAGAEISRIGTVLSRLCGEAITIELRTGPDACQLPLSTLAVEQVLMNLAINARDAMPDGGTLTISAGPGISATGDAVAVITVTDTGAGMDRETVDRIFTPYFTTKPVGKGTGLGLSAVRAIVEQAGGSIGATSSPGRGTSFRIEFPAPAQQR